MSQYSGSNNNTRTDRFGNAYQIVSIKDKKGTGFPYGYIELKGQLYKIDVSDKTKKDGVDFWVKVTKVNPRTKSSM